MCSRLIRSVVLANLAAVLGAAAPAAHGADAGLRAWPAQRATPALRLSDLDGRDWDLARLRGKVVVLNFWAGWCAPCVDELPVLGRLARGAREDLVVLGVNYKEGLDAIARFTAGHPLAYPVLRDRDGAAFAAWTAGVMPTTILIDKRGRARWRTAGQIDADDTRLKKSIDALLAEPPTARKPADNKPST